MSKEETVNKNNFIKNIYNNFKINILKIQLWMYN